jgi:hypothetical protein
MSKYRIKVCVKDNNVDVEKDNVLSFSTLPNTSTTHTFRIILKDDTPIKVTAPQRFTQYEGVDVGVNSNGKDYAYSTNGTDWYRAGIDNSSGFERMKFVVKNKIIRVPIHRLVIFLWGTNSEGFISYKKNRYSFKKISPQSIPLNWSSGKDNIIKHLDGNVNNNDFRNLAVIKLNEENIHTTSMNWVTSSWLNGVQKVGKDLYVEFKNKKTNTGRLIKYPNEGIKYKALYNAPSKGKFIWQYLMPKPHGHNTNYEVVR